MNEYVTLKPDDQAPRDPHAVGVELMALLRSISEDAHYLRGLLTRPGADPLSLQTRAQGLAIDIAADAGRATDAVEALLQALRAARLFSTEYSR